MGERLIDTRRIDDAILALMYLNFFNFDRSTGTVRSWKTFDWDAMDRLHKRDLILDPVSKARSVVLTPEGKRLSQELFERLFTTPPLETQASAGPRTTGDAVTKPGAI